MTTRVLLVDDHKIVRQGLRLLLEAEEDLAVIAEAADGLEAAAIVAKERPDVLVADLRMPGLNGVELTRLTGEKSPGTVTVILSMFCDEAYVDGALAAGARGYVAKESSVEELVFAIHEALAGRVFISPQAMTKGARLPFIAATGPAAVPGNPVENRRTVKRKVKNV